MYFEILGPITDIETIAVGRAIRDLARLQKRYGRGRWRKLKGVARVRVGQSDEVLRLSTSGRGHKFAICVKNTGAEDLEVWKVYRVVPDRRAAMEGCLRVIDESREDYLYPADYFAFVALPEKARRAWLASAPAALSHPRPPNNRSQRTALMRRR